MGKSPAAPVVPLLETVRLSRNYQVGSQLVPALQHLDLVVKEGEFLAIMGPSGSGKSTCLHVLGCLQRPSSGSYRFAGQDVTSLDAKATAALRNKDIGFVFQGFHLLPRATAQVNVELPLVYAGVSRAQRPERASEALVAVGLGNRMHHRPGELSGGQMQRVAIARALVNRPRLLLLDEPTGALDSVTGQQILDLLAGLHAQGITIVLVSHDPGVAARADRVLHMRDGRQVSAGLPR